jgi:hypothetical protein
MTGAKLLSLSMTSTAALLVAVSGPAAKSTVTGCFRCNEEFHQIYQRWQHYDAQFAVEGDPYQGNMHDMDWSTCIGAISSAGHQVYGLESFGGDALDIAVTNGSDEELLAVLTTSPNVEINLQRSALQILNEMTNEVVYHAQLPRAQLERLASALAVRNARQ